VDNLVFKRVPQPAVRDGQVKVRVSACGVCHRDCLDRRGAFPFIHRPTILGHEIAGTVVEVAAGVSTLAVGDKGVCLALFAWPSWRALGLSRRREVADAFAW
jgi:D-arabinose 1-dehydrogenase-like Zn-dependent alcohol dehydrogenase